MATLVYKGGPQDGTEHRVPGATPPPVRYWALPGERASVKSWLDLHRYVSREALNQTTYSYEYTGTFTVKGPIPARGVNGAEPIEGWH